MTVRSLTEALVARSKLRSKLYIIRDRKLKGFHLKISPSGQVYQVPHPDADGDLETKLNRLMEQINS